MKNIRGVWADAGREQQRYIKHLTIRTMHPASLAEFYIDVYEFKEEEKALEDPNFYLTDGKVTLVIAPWKIEDYYGTEHRAPGLDHVDELECRAFKNDVEMLTRADPEWLAPKSPNLTSEHDVVIGLLQSCQRGKHQSQIRRVIS